MNHNNTLTTIMSRDYSAIERAGLQPSTQAKYKREIDNLLDAGINPMDYRALQVYADGFKVLPKIVSQVGIAVDVPGV